MHYSFIRKLTYYYCETHVTFCDLFPRNNYEAQIFSGWGAVSGERLERMNYATDSTAPLIYLHEQYEAFFLAVTNSHSRHLFKDDSDRKMSKNLMPAIQSFEFDFYVKPLGKDSFGDVSPLEKSISDFLRDGADLIVPINQAAKAEVNAMVAKPLQWVYMEISDSPRQLVNKLWQLERNLRLCPELERMGISGVAVLLNGEREIAENAIRGITIPHDLLINRYPVFVGWVPTRNIYASVLKLDDKISVLSNSVSQLSTTVSQLSTNVSKLSSNVDLIMKHLNI